MKTFVQVQVDHKKKYPEGIFKLKYGEKFKIHQNQHISLFIKQSEDLKSLELQTNETSKSNKMKFKPHEVEEE